MSTTNNIKANYLALVQSGNIRYEWLPAGQIACATAAWAQLLAAAATPAVPWWICGFRIGYATGLVVEQGWRVSLGYGGVDGAAIAATTIIAIGVPFTVVGAAAAAMGAELGWMFPHPVQIPIDITDPGSRVAYSVVNNPVGGAAVGLTSCRICIAYGVGT